VQRYSSEMRPPLQPKQMVQLLVVTLLVLMGAGVVMMYRSGPPRGQLYAMLQRR
jgi:uncharacterized membrane protein